MRKAVIIILMWPMVCMAQSDVLQNFLLKMERQTLESDFSVTISEKATQPTTLNGHILMHGEQFKADIMGMEVAYDGITLYTYNEGNDELTLSTPMPDELAEVNPLLFAKAIAGNCQTEVREQGGNYTVTLLPDNSAAGVREFTLQLRKHDLMPMVATMKETGMKTTTLLFREPSFVTTASEFSINKPNAYINDLR